MVGVSYGGCGYTSRDIVEMDRLLSISRDLSQKVDTNETAANELLQQCEVLQQKIKAMIEVNINSHVINWSCDPHLSIRVLFKRLVEAKIILVDLLELNLVIYVNYNKIIQNFVHC